MSGNSFSIPILTKRSTFQSGSVWGAVILGKTGNCSSWRDQQGSNREYWWGAGTGILLVMGVMTTPRLIGVRKYTLQ